MDNFRHRRTLQVRFNDLDMLGHVNNSIYFQYMDLGKTEYFAEVLNTSFDFEREALVIGHIDCQFCRITPFGEPLEVQTRCSQIKEHSLVLEQRIVNPSTSEVKAEASVVMIGYNFETNAKMRIPDSWRAKIADYEKWQGLGR